MSRIVLQTQYRGLETRGSEKQLFKVEQYHMVDLDQGIIHPNISKPMLICHGVGRSTMVSLGNDSVYMFGGCDSADQVTKIESYESQHSNDTFYLGAAHMRILVNKDDGKVSGEWCKIPQRVFCQRNANCIHLNGKIYNFGINKFCPQVFDPTSKTWNNIPFPSQFEFCAVSMTVLPDPSANRIILHLRRGTLISPSIYAFHHTDNGRGQLRSIVGNFNDWDSLAAYADDVIYFHRHRCPNLLRAYDLKSLEWLTVEWSETVFGDWNLIDLRKNRFEHLLSLGDNSFCLVTYWSVYHKAEDNDEIVKIRVLIIKFRAERTDSTIRLLPQLFRSFDLPRTSYLRNMVPLS